MSVNGVNREYVFPIVNPSLKRYRVITFLLVILSSLIFFVSYTQYNSLIQLILSISLVLIAIIIFVFFIKKNKPTFPGHWVLLAIGVLMLSILPAKWPGIFYIILALISYKLNSSLKIIFSETDIQVQFILNRRYAWGDLSYSVLKDGLLTIGFLNNRILQHEIEAESLPDEQEFNRFLQSKLNTDV